MLWICGITSYFSWITIKYLHSSLYLVSRSLRLSQPFLQLFCNNISFTLRCNLLQSNILRLNFLEIEKYTIIKKGFAYFLSYLNLESLCCLYSLGVRTYLNSSFMKFNRNNSKIFRPYKAGSESSNINIPQIAFQLDSTHAHDYPWDGVLQTNLPFQQL